MQVNLKCLRTAISLGENVVQGPIGTKSHREFFAQCTQNPIRHQSIFPAIEPLDYFHVVTQNGIPDSFLSFLILMAKCRNLNGFEDKQSAVAGWPRRLHRGESCQFTQIYQFLEPV